MFSLLKILVDQRCQVYCDHELKGEACPNSLFTFNLRKGTYILEFKIGEDILTKEFSIDYLNEEILLRVSLKDLPSRDDYYIKSIGSNQYLYNSKHNEVVDLPYKEYKEITDLMHQNGKIYATLLHNKWGAIKYNGKELIAPKFQSFYKLLFDKYLCFEEYKDRYQIFSLLGDLICSISGFGNLYNHLNYLVFKDHHGNSAIYDNRLRPRTLFAYDEIESFGEEEDNHFKVLKDGYWGIIQLSENPSKNLTILPCKFQEIESSFPGFSIRKYVQVKYQDVYCFLDKDGQMKEDSKDCNEIKEQFVFAKKYFPIGRLIKSKLNI